MSLAVDPRFAYNHRFYTCQGGNTSAGGHDVRVMAWQFRTRPVRAVLVRRLLVGIPATSGTHGGCRLLIARNGSLIVGTGDATVGTNPRDLTSLGGKTLRLNRFSGAPWPNNPDVDSTNRNRRYVMTFGHRNVQGLAQRADGTLWSAEHGPDRDDEVNRLRVGGDYGWHPVPGYNETRADDRPEPARHPVRGPVAVGHPDPGDLGHRLGPAATSGAPTAGRWRWRRSRPRG